MSNTEALKNPEAPKAKQELKELKLDVSKDYEKFKTLSKNPVLKSGLNKLYNKNCEEIFSEEWKHFKKLHIGGTLQKILKKYPNLLLYITGNLGLPLDEKNFSKLSLEQKLNFTALYQSVTANGFFDKKNATSQDILERVERNSRANMGKINRNFERKNIKNFLDLEKTLKNFGLNSDEIGKIKEYLLIIKEHPEFVNGLNIQKAGIGSGGRMVIGIIIGGLLGVLGKHYIDNLGKIQPETTIRTDGITTIENPERVLKLLTQQADFHRSGQSTVKMFSENEGDGVIVSFLKDVVNRVQSRQIDMELSGKLALQFDLDKGSKIDIHSKNGKGIAYVQLPKPDVIVTNSKAKILSENREWVHLSQFNQTQEELRQELEAKAIADAKNAPDFYEKGKKDIEKQLYDLLSALHPEGIDIVSVKVSFFDPNIGPASKHPDYVPESDRRTYRLIN